MYNKEHAAPLDYVNQACQATSAADRKWITDHLSELLQNIYPLADWEAAAIAYLQTILDFDSPVRTQSLHAALYAITTYRSTQLTAFHDPACTSVGSSAFSGCTALREVSLPACTSVGSNAFQDCTALREVSLPACTSVVSNAFVGCTALREVSLPACTSVWSTAFLGCTALRHVVFAAALPTGTIPANARLMKYTYTGLQRQNLNFAVWNPTYVNTYPDLDNEVIDRDHCSTNAEQIDYSARLIGEQLLDLNITGQSFTVTFAASVYNRMTPDTFAVFAAKGWTVAQA